MAELTLDAEWGTFVSASIGDAALPQNNLTGNGYGRHTPTTAKKLSSTPAAGVALPLDAQHAIISIEANPIRFRVDGTAPTASEGVLLPVGTILPLTNQRAFLAAFWFIDTAAGASQVSVAYGRIG